MYTDKFEIQDVKINHLLRVYIEKIWTAWQNAKKIYTPRTDAHKLIKNVYTTYIGSLFPESVSKTKISA